MRRFLQHDLPKGLQFATSASGTRTNAALPAGPACFCACKQAQHTSPHSLPDIERSIASDHAARAHTSTRYWWGDTVGTTQAPLICTPAHAAAAATSSSSASSCPNSRKDHEANVTRRTNPCSRVPDTPRPSASPFLLRHEVCPPQPSPQRRAHLLSGSAASQLQLFFWLWHLPQATRFCTRILR
jgi:hypothetical protein